MRAVLIVLPIILSSASFAQRVENAPDWQVPRTEFGHPDLQGDWGNLNQAPLERPVNLGTRRFYTEEEAQEVRDSRTTRYDNIASPLNPNRGAPPAGVVIGQEADINFNPERMVQIYKINGEYRTSLIIDPVNGRLPYREDRAEDIYEKWLSAGFGAFDGPEIRPANERCHNSPAQLPLIVPLNSTHTRYMQIVQTEDYVILFGEYSAGLRIVRLGGEHPTKGWAKWRGDSIGYWEGNSLVIHTNDFKPEQSHGRLRSSAVLEVRETLTAVSADEILYSYTISDPTMYTQPFTAEMQLSRLAEDERLFESACHEGNYSLPGILAGARVQERDSK